MIELISRDPLGWAFLVFLVLVLGAVVHELWKFEPHEPKPVKPPVLDRIAAQLDASPKVREDWRDFFKFRSVQWNVISVANALSMAVGAYEASQMLPAAKTLPLWASVIVSGCSAIGVFYGVLTKQSNLSKPVDPAQSKDDAS